MNDWGQRARADSGMRTVMKQSAGEVNHARLYRAEDKIV